MGFRCGIVGLPNVGKSTLFNALTNAALADTGNYPFCTVEPNVGRVPVPDRELETVAKIAASASIVPTMLEVLDIAGLVRGASQGEGLGNKFLAQIREVEAILHVVRCFEDDQISHVEGPVDPIRDIDLIETELMLADLESLERQFDGVVKRATRRAAFTATWRAASSARKPSRSRISSPATARPGPRRPARCARRAPTMRYRKPM